MVLAMMGKVTLLAWDVTADREESWRRFLQELSGSRYEEYMESRRRLGISVESVWLAPKPSGGGVAVVFLEAEDPEWALRELVAELYAISKKRRICKAVMGSDAYPASA